MDLARITLTGDPIRVEAAGGDVPAPGVLGVDVAARVIDGQEWTVVQVLLDDDDPAFDLALLDAPLLATVTDPDGDVLAREPFDHDRFRRDLRDERERGESSRRGVLVTTGGHLPPRYVRLAFLPVALGTTAGASLTLTRTTTAALRQGVEDAFARGEITDAERHAALATIAQRHPS